ncbi:MAG TPA: RagB/SusD family nutrient uptake outer membrane protein [Gemmatimonadales bacterium]|nr:RagB/SusD family nutrient uptake outer membrane protein [Gemmatimonadales bacterium]
MHATKAFATLLVAAGLTGCANLLEQTAPSRVLEETLLVPANSKLLVDGARAAFGCAYQAYVTASGLVSDEMEDTQLGAAGWDYDRRSIVTIGIYAESTCETSQLFGIYRPMQTARFQADFATQTITAFPDAEVQDKGTLLATAALFAGYSYLLLGEGFCSMAVSAPEEILNDQGGAELTSVDMFEVAEARFTQAIDLGTTAGVTDIVNAARVGRARARLNLAKFPGQPVDNAKLVEARADAAAVPGAFEYNLPYQTAGSPAYAQNLLYRRQRDFFQYGIAPTFRDLTFGGVPDPRTAVTNTGVIGADGVSIVWAADKYPAQNSPIRLASWEEAQLIIAEIDGGQAAVDIINTLHDAVGLPDFNSADPVAIFNQVIQERDRELFLEGHRMWTIRRLDLPFNPPVGTVYPIKGGTYGDTRCFPLPDIERNNNPGLGGN